MSGSQDTLSHTHTRRQHFVTLAKTMGLDSQTDAFLATRLAFAGCITEVVFKISYIFVFLKFKS